MGWMGRMHMGWMENRNCFNPKSELFFSKETSIILLGKLMLLQIFGMFVFPQCQYMSYMLHIYIYMSIYILHVVCHICDIKQELGENKQNDEASNQWFFRSAAVAAAGLCRSSFHRLRCDRDRSGQLLEITLGNCQFQRSGTTPPNEFYHHFTIFFAPFVGIYKMTCLGARQNRLSVGDLGVNSAEICRKMLGSSGGLNMFQHMGVSKNNGTPKSSILIGFSIINHPFWGPPLFLETSI